MNEPPLTYAVILLSLTIGGFLYAPAIFSRSRSESSRFGLIGISAGFFGVLAVASGAAVYLALSGQQSASLAASVVTTALFVALGASGKLAANLLDSVAARSDFSSAHGAFADTLSSMGDECSEPALKDICKQLAEDARYLARDNGLAVDAVLRALVNQGGVEGATVQAGRIRALFSERETQLKRTRSKV